MIACNAMLLAGWILNMKWNELFFLPIQLVYLYNGNKIMQWNLHQEFEFPGKKNLTKNVLSVIDRTATFYMNVREKIEK